MQNFNGVGVVNTGELLFYRSLEFGGIAFQDFQIVGAVFKHLGHNVFDKIFGQVHIIVQIVVGYFGFHHPEFGQMAAGFAFFGAEGGAKAVSAAQRHSRSFAIELPALREESLLPEVISFKQRAGAFAGGGG